MKNKLKDFLIALIAGSLYALAYPSFLGESLWFFIFPAVLLFLWKLEEASFKKSLFIIFGFNLGLNLTGYYWIPHTLREFGQLPFILSIIIGATASLILQPHWWFYAIWKKYRPQRNWNSEKYLLINIFIIVILERFIPQQFPSFAGSPWITIAPYIGLAPIFGVIIYSFVTYWISFEIIIQLSQKKIRYPVWIFSFLFLITNFIFKIEKNQSQEELPIRIVQANIGNFLKISSEKGDQNSFEAIEKKYEDLSLKNNGFSPKLIIWPETAYADSFFGIQTKLSPYFLKMIQDSKAELLIGGYDQDPSKSPFDLIESVFNSSLLLSEDKVKSVYHKNRLIPFGETLPFGPLNKEIVSLVPSISLFAQGSGTPIMETKTGHRFITPICYEILDSNFVRSLLNQWGENDFIVNHTNDSWYGDTAEPYQHLFLSKWRAIEFQLPIIRSTNTGISSVIYNDGSESKRLSIGEIGILDLKIALGKDHKTLYQTWGLLNFVILFLFLLTLIWWKEKTENRP